jgi:hypothetical protein
MANQYSGIHCLRCISIFRPSLLKLNRGKDSEENVCTEFTLDRNMRRILVCVRTTGPLLIVTGEYIEDIITRTTETPLTEITLNTGTPVSFCWSADASAYCGVVTGYRYGLDINDLDDDDQWTIDFTPFVGEEACSPTYTFYFGVLVFYVEVIDNDGYKSRVPIKIHYLPDVPVEQTNWGRIKAFYGQIAE